jgi:hypothetical protein
MTEQELDALFAEADRLSARAHRRPNQVTVREYRKVTEQILLELGSRVGVTR